MISALRNALSTIQLYTRLTKLDFFIIKNLIVNVSEEVWDQMDILGAPTERPGAEYTHPSLLLTVFIDSTRAVLVYNSWGGLKIAQFVIFHIGKIQVDEPNRTFSQICFVYTWSSLLLSARIIIWIINFTFATIRRSLYNTVMLTVFYPIVIAQSILNYIRDGHASGTEERLLLRWESLVSRMAAENGFPTVTGFWGKVLYFITRVVQFGMFFRGVITSIRSVMGRGSVRAQIFLNDLEKKETFSFCLPRGVQHASQLSAFALGWYTLVHFFGNNIAASFGVKALFWVDVTCFYVKQYFLEITARITTAKTKLLAFGESAMVFYTGVFIFFFFYATLTWSFIGSTYAAYTITMYETPAWYTTAFGIFEYWLGVVTSFWLNLISPHTYLFSTLLFSSLAVTLTQLCIQKYELNVVANQEDSIEGWTTPKVWLVFIWVALSYQLFYVYRRDLFSASIICHLQQQVFDNLQTQVVISLDTLSFKFILITLLIGAATNLYIPIYMKKEPHINRFVLLINGFLFSMLILLASGNLITLLVGWELIGIFSYLLINFWTVKITAFKSAFKALTYNQVSDLSLILGMVLYFNEFSTLNFAEINSSPTFGRVGIVAVLLFYISACCKSAQFFFHFWLPDSMEAPVPASALIHSATLVSAGIFLILKMKPIVNQSLLLETVIIISATLTIIVGGVSATLQNDLKKTLAYSTISNCGLIMLSTCITTVDNSYLLFAIHGIFKAYTFFCVGSLIIVHAHKQDWRYVSAVSATHPSLAVVTIFSLYNLGAWDNSLYYLIKHGCANEVLQTGSFFKNSLLSTSLLFITVTSAIYSIKIVYLVNFKKLNLLKYAPINCRVSPAISLGAFVMLVTLGLYFYHISPTAVLASQNLTIIHHMNTSSIFNLLAFFTKSTAVLLLFKSFFGRSEENLKWSLVPLLLYV